MVAMLGRHGMLSAALIGLVSLAPATCVRGKATQPPANAIALALQPSVDAGQIAGAVGLVATSDRILESAAVGVSNLATHRPMRADDIFWIASMSKPVAGIALGILRDRGALNFDDPVSRFVPEFAAVRDARGAPLTLRELMTHTGGLGEQMHRPPHQTLAQTAAMAARTPLAYPVGARWSYSTLGIDVLGRVIEVAGKMPLDTFLEKEIFRPLGMKQTCFWLSPSELPRYARSYRMGDDGTLQPAKIPYLYDTDPTDKQRPPLIGAGLFSTAGDIARLYQMLLGRGAREGARILQPETLAELARNQTGDLVTRPGMSWGLTFSVVEDPGKLEGNVTLSPGTFGHGGAFGTASWVDLKAGAVYVLMLQRAELPNPDNSQMRIAFQTAAAGIVRASKRGQ
ncbi:serine hydrolase domain-containing protein [Sphingomonas sp. BIUV-7]|uniref:Serine hydrolase domain-containing protein n=1 Tax=Sphingomonas natans TaxID=3063330 RepID=A0ABT8Y7P0_9SPHN|nr:serine hydrolase domain-containing protein [Sphingomonas sp. BIUV-7]MDO6414340.1 serine hydrolase domain-containing protein [Sphingomonas sp. BIUV-7]